MEEKTFQNIFNLLNANTQQQNESFWDESFLTSQNVVDLLVTISTSFSAESGGERAKKQREVKIPFRGRATIELLRRKSR